MKQPRTTIQIPHKFGDLLLTCVEDRIHWMSGILIPNQYYRDQLRMLNRIRETIKKQK